MPQPVWHEPVWQIMALPQEPSSLVGDHEEVLVPGWQLWQLPFISPEEWNTPPMLQPGVQAPVWQNCWLGQLLCSASLTLVQAVVLDAGLQAWQAPLPVFAA